MRCVSARGRCLVRDDTGLSLIEVLVSMVVFGLVATAGTSVILNAINVSRGTRNRSIAAGLAAQQLEAVRNTSITNFTSLTPPGTSTSNATVGTQSFVITQRSSWLPKATSGSCDASSQGGSSTVQPVLLVQDLVTWTNMGGTKPVQNATELTPPPGLFSGTTGGINVKILDHASNPVADIPVQFTSGGVTTTVTSNADGCAFAAYLTPATYTVSTTKTGYVDGQEAATSTQTISVTSGVVSTPTFLYDTAATLTTSFATGPLSPATGLPITVYNTTLSGTGTYTFANGTTSLNPLFPYSGYSIWAGRCPEADPNAVNTSNAALYPGATRTSTPTSAGVTTPVAVPLYPLNVTVKYGAAVVAATLTLTEQAGSAKFSCGAPFNTYGLTAAPATGLSATAVPLGTFTVRAVSQTKSGTATVTVGPSGATAIVTVS